MAVSSLSPHSPSKTGVNALVGERVGVRAESQRDNSWRVPSPGPLRGPTSPRKRGEVN